MRLSTSPIEPIVKERTVRLDQSAAFELFTAKLDTWWPLETHSIGQTAAGSVRFDDYVGGRVVETTVDGDEHSWADVIAWDPPHRFCIAWHPAIDPESASIVEVRFVPAGAGTRIELTHSGWEEFGDDGKRLRDQYDPGWDFVLQPIDDL